MITTFINNGMNVPRRLSTWSQIWQIRVWVLILSGNRVDRSSLLWNSQLIAQASISAMVSTFPLCAYYVLVALLLNNLVILL